ncbi:MAG: NfeD family protein [Pseudomonadota bacterium]
MIVELIRELGPWTWWVIGFLLLIVEIFAPGAFFLWVGLAALIVGTNALFIPMGWQLQVALFAVLSIVLAVIGRKVSTRFRDGAEGKVLNERGRDLIGRSYVLSDMLENGEGRMKVGDTYWMVRSATPLEAGAKVVVSEVDGSVLLVEPA